MSKQVLSIEQMWHLEELMPLKNVYDVDFIWWGKGKGINHKKYNYQLYCSKTANANPMCDWVYPAYTLQDILDLLPCVIKAGNTEYSISIYPINGKWAVDYCSETGADIQSSECEHLIDAVYSRLLWCIEQGYV